MKDSPLDSWLSQYEKAIAALVESAPTPEQVLKVLTARDAVQKTLTETTHISASNLLKLDELDRFLRSKQSIIGQTHAIDLVCWRKLLKPNSEAWWWFSHSSSPSRWESFDWLGNFLTLIFVTASASLTVDMFTRFLSGGLDFFSALTVIIPSLLALLTSGALTGVGQKARQTVLSSLKVPQKYWQSASTALALGVLLVLIGFYEVGLPRIGVYFNKRGVENYLADRLDSALSDLNRAISLRPNYAGAHYHLGLLYEDLHKFDRAKTEYHLAVENSADLLDTLTPLKAQNNLGRLYLLEKNYAAAISPLLQGKNAIDEEKMAVTPELRQLKYALLKNLGWAQLGQKNAVEAAALLNEAIALDSEQAAAYCLLAQVDRERQEIDTAHKNWEQCLAYADISRPEEYQWRSLALEAIAKGEP